MEIQGKTAIVTGSGSGIGRGVCLALAKRHCNLVMVDLSKERMEETRALVSGYGIQTAVYAADLSNRQQINALPERILSENDSVDLLFNIAGICAGGTFMQISDEAFDKVIAVDFLGMAYMMKRFLPHLLKRPEAYVVNMSSIQGILPFPGDSAYSAAKFAVRGLTCAVDCEMYDDPTIHFAYVLQGGAKTGIITNAIPVNEEALTPEELAIRKAKLAKFTQQLGMEPEQAGEAIVGGVEKNEKRIVVGEDAQQLLDLEKLEPVEYWSILRTKLHR